jgi:AcrR family transcriptional regulator
VRRETDAPIGRPPVASLDGIVDAALAVGLPGLTMDAVADHLGIGQATLYNYVASKRSLIGAVVARLMSDLAVSEDPQPDLRALLFDFGMRLHDQLGDVPGFAEALTDHVGDAAMLEIEDRFYAALMTHDVDAPTAVLLGADTFSFVVAYSTLDLGGDPAGDAPPEVIGRAATTLATITARQRFEWTLAAHLDGMIAAIERGSRPWQ